VLSTLTLVVLYNPLALSMFFVYIPLTMLTSTYVALVVVLTTTKALAAITVLLLLGLLSSSTCLLRSFCTRDLTFY
jgi:hypothetical protein